MSKKRAKSGAGSAGVSRWESGIVQASFEEENWKASIALIVGNRLEDSENIQILSAAVDSGLRKLFTVISRETLTAEVNELGNPKLKKPKDVPLFSEICEVAKGHLDQGEQIPLPLLAKLLKWKLLDVKHKDVKRREDDQKAANGKGKGKEGGKRPRSKSPAKGKGKNKSPEIPSPKKDSKLKKRGEDDQENKFIDDEPDDGPQHYVLIEGFDHAPLLILLAEIEVYVDSIIRIQSEDYGKFEKRKDEGEEEEEEEKPQEVVEAEKAKREKAIADLEKFWQQHEPFLNKAPKGSRLHHVARLTYTVKDKMIPDDLQDNELRTEFGTALFEDVACLMYDLLDSRRQYLHYLDNMKLIQVPLVGPHPPAAVSDAQSAVSVPGLAPPATDVLGEGKVQSSEVDTRYYTEMMDCIPQESVSVPLIMHCMLEQIVATEEEKLPPSEKAATPRDDGLEHSLAMHIEKMAAKLQTGNSSGDILATKSSASESNKPHFYHHGDNIARRLHHLKSINGLNPIEAELAMMDYVPVAKLREFPRPSTTIAKERAARLHELIHFCTSGSIDQAEFSHAFKQFVFESLKLRETDKEGLVLDSETSGSHVVWDDPYPLFKKEEEDSQAVDVPLQIAVPQLPGEEEPQPSPKADSVESNGSQLGILKTSSRSRQGSAASVRSSKSTEPKDDDDDVHFEKDASGQPIIPDKDTVAVEMSNPTDTMDSNCLAPPVKKTRPGSASCQIGVQDVTGKQFRSLDDWKFAEHFQPSVLIQILEEARQVYPYMDTYYHKRDHSLLVVMHNPVGPNLQNYEPWNAKLHSDVGFRNYMEHVCGIPEVAGWTREEEVIYQAEVARKEIEALKAAASSPTPSSRPSSSKSRKRSASPKKTRSKSPKGRKSASPTLSVDNLDPNSKHFMRPNSMKQWKIEQDKLKEEEERKRQEKEKKGRPKSRSRSASPKKDDKDKKDDKKEKRPGSGRSSRKGKEDKDKGDEPKPAEGAEVQEPKEPERIYPFTGYDVGNDLIHGSGSTSTMFPCDGGQIRTEKTQIINGLAFVKTSVLKDGHIFVVHIVEPREPSEEDDNDDTPQDGEDKESVTEKADQEKSEKEDKPATEAVNITQDAMSDGRSSAASGDMSIVIGSDGRASAAGSEAQSFRDGESPTKQMILEDGLDVGKAPEPAQKKKKPLSLFGSFTAALNDGMMLSFSNYGSEGKSSAAEEKPEVDVYIPPPASPSPPPPAQSPTGKRGGSGGKKGKKQQQQMQAEQEKLAQQALEQQQKEEEERKRKLLEEMAKAQEPEVPPFQQLYISCPDGLHVTYLTEAMAGVKPDNPSIPDHLLVRQSYPYKTTGKQQCESARQTPGMEESSRLITCDGTVIKTMRDGTTQVLFADGTVSCSAGACSSSSATHSRDPSPQRGPSAMSMAQGNEAATKKVEGRIGKGKGKGKGKRHKGKTKKNEDEMGVNLTAKGKTADKVDDNSAVEVSSEPTKEWVTTTPDGTRIATKPDGSICDVKPCMLFSATDPVTKEVMTTREDRVVIVERPDKTCIVDHNEGTRITTYYTQVEVHEDCQEYEETGETPPAKMREVKQVKVECVGYATVIFNCEDSIATTIFGNGSQVISIPDGSYEVFHSEGSRLHIDADGTALYTPKQEQQKDNPDTLYTMRHKHPVVFEMVDMIGNMFSVQNTGEVQVMKGLDLEESKGNGEEGDEKQETKKEKGAMDEENQHAPRFFVIHDDGSGMELLRMKDIREYLEIADRDPTTAILADPVPDHPDIKGINVMRPYNTSISQSWLVQFDESNIIPAHLRSRDFSKLPPYEAKKPGPKFGTNVGKGLAVGSAAKSSQRGPIPACPKHIELRQFTEYKPMNKELRERMRVGLEAYAKEMEKKRNTWTENAVKDPRSEEEKAGAGELLAHILAQDEETLPNTDGASQPDGTAATEGVPETNATSPASQPAHVPTPKPMDVTGSDDVKTLYEKATAPAPSPPAPKPKNKYTDSDWERVRKELDEEQACRKALQKREVPKYFDSEWGKSFLLTLSAGPDMDALTKNLAVETRKGEGEGPDHSLPSTPIDTPSSTQNASGEGIQSTADSTSPQKQANVTTSREGNQVTPTQGGLQVSSPSDVRPLNPTPRHAQGTATPTSLRPTNPTPGHASLQGAPVRPGNPTPGSVTDNNTSGNFPSETPSSYASFPNHPSTIPEQAEEGLTERSETEQSGVMKLAGGEANNNPDKTGYLPSAQSDLILTKSLVTDVNGEPRKDTVRLPAAILGTKPGALPNERFQTLEDPVRRKILNSSIAGAEAKGIAPLSKMRGFELVPGEVHFGILREGCTYAFTVHLKNVGIDACRYKIRQPPPATGLQVVYKPGPIAAGMKAQLELQLYSIAVGVRGGSGQGSIGHHIEIVTETERLYLPVSATILTAYEYDECCRTQGKPPLSAGVRLISNRPPSREGIVRPRRDNNNKDTRVELDSQLVQ